MRKRNKRWPKEEQLLNLLKDIESGKVSVKLDKKESADSAVYHFDTSNKWGIGIFIDCGEFDYIEYICHGGKIIDYDKLHKFYPKVTEYALKFRDGKLAKKVWGIELKLYVD